MGYDNNMGIGFVNRFNRNEMRRSVLAVYKGAHCKKIKPMLGNPQCFVIWSSKSPTSWLLGKGDTIKSAWADAFNRITTEYK